MRFYNPMRYGIDTLYTQLWTPEYDKNATKSGILATVTSSMHINFSI
jgi:hypothetical protein